MATTRYAPAGANPEENPERNLANARLRGINIGLNIIARIARVLPQAERDAMIWLHNYARLRDLTADALSAELDLDKSEIRRALTDPDADRMRFVRQVGIVRAAFEKCRTTYRRPDVPSEFRLIGKFDESLGAIANTKVRRKVGQAIRMATKSPQIVEILGKTRLGKSISARHEFLGIMHHAAWLHCPRPGNERDFLNAMADALGVACGSCQKNSQILPKIEACFGPNRIRVLFVDEAHRLWPNDWRHEPKRIELLRDWWERLGLSIIILATDQYSEAVQDAMQSDRWAPGQWVGRVQPFDLPEALEDVDLAAIAKHHAPDANDAVVAQLISHAKTSAGYCGAMVKAIERVRFRTGDDGKLTVEEVRKAQVQIDREARLLALASVKKKRQGQIGGPAK